MDQLAGLTEESRKLALDRFRLLQPHLEDGRQLRVVAAAAGIPFRTAQRWVSLYRRFGHKSDEAFSAENAFYEQRDRAMLVARAFLDQTTLLIIDEADRLKMAGLDQVRSIFDHGGIGLVLTGMPGIEKRLARYPQFYSRIGFVHEFRPLSAAETRQLLEQRWTPPGVNLPAQPWEPEAVAAIIRMTGGNFRLLNRFLTQIERILEINALREVSKAVVEAARESLVIGQA